LHRCWRGKKCVRISATSSSFQASNPFTSLIVFLFSRLLFRCFLSLSLFFFSFVSLFSPLDYSSLPFFLSILFNLILLSLLLSLHKFPIFLVVGRVEAPVRLCGLLFFLCITKFISRLPLSSESVQPPSCSFFSCPLFVTPRSFCFFALARQYFGPKTTR